MTPPKGCRSAIFLSARMKATRLPNKQLLEIGGRSITAHLIDRLKKSRKPALIALTTSTHPDDAVLVKLAEAEGIQSFCGSPEDKLNRYLEAARHFAVDFAAIVDGDDPFCDPEIIDRTIELYEETGVDYIAGKNLPVGVACHGVSTRALQRVCEMKSERDTEVWGHYFTQTGLFDVRTFEPDPHFRRPDLRMTLDYPQDFDFFKEIFKHLYQSGQVFSLVAILQLLDAHPEIVAINREIQAIYEKNLQRITKIPRLRTTDEPTVGLRKGGD